MSAMPALHAEISTLAELQQILVHHRGEIIAARMRVVNAVFGPAGGDAPQRIKDQLTTALEAIENTSTPTHAAAALNAIADVIEFASEMAIAACR